jgi:hypothetical protein
MGDSIMVTDNTNTVWRRGNDDIASSPEAQPLASAVVAPPAPTQAPPAAPAAYYESDAGSPLPRAWLIALAGAVMGGILSIAVYSQAVGSGGTPGGFAFGGPGGARGGAPQPQFQGPNQGGVQQNGGIQRNQNQGPVPGGQGPAQGNAIPGGTNGGPAAIAGLPRAPDFSGSIRNISGSSATVDTPQGTRVVEVDSQTQVIKVDGSAGSPSDLSRGAVIAVVASTDPNTRLLRADAIAILR